MEDCRDEIVGGCPQASDVAAIANSMIRFADTPPIRRPSRAFPLWTEIEAKYTTWGTECAFRSTGARSAECDDGGAPASGFRRRVPKLGHKRSAGKHGADGFALRSDAAPVDDPQGAVAHPVRFDEVFFNNGAHVPRRDAVQVEHIGDGNADGLVVFCLHKPQKRKTRPHERDRAGKTTQLPSLRAPDV